MLPNDYYSSEKLTAAMTAIFSMTGEIMYLIEGNKEAVLVDTSIGVGNLKAFVVALTPKPIKVILTHGHVDHAMGAGIFKEVYMNEADKKVFYGHRNLEIRKEYMKLVLKDRMPMIEDADFVAPFEPDFFELHDEDIFDLGGLHIKVFSAKGHTPGSMAVLIEEERGLILGDACNAFTFVFDENSSFIEEYKASMKELKKKTDGLYDSVYMCHRTPLAPNDVIENVIAVCDDIIEGKTDDIQFNFMGYSALIAKAINERGERLDGKFGNIVFNKSKIFL